MSSVTATDGTSTATTDTSSSSTKTSTLGYSDFLNLLTVQLQNQDPFDPMSDTDFIAQMANFSTLEEVDTFSTNFSTYSSRQQQLSSQSFLGKNVTVEPSGSSSASGTVTAVTLDDDGSIYVTVGGNQYDATDVTSVSTASSD